MDFLEKNYHTIIYVLLIFPDLIMIKIHKLINTDLFVVNDFRCKYHDLQPKS